MSSDIKELLELSPYFTREYLNQQLTIWFEQSTEYAKHEFGKGTGKGDSYLSDMHRIVLYGKTLDNHSDVKIHLLIKKMPKNIARRKTFRCEQFFKNEINFYLHILPELIKFQKEKNITKPFDCVPKLFGAISDGDNDFLVLEDLNFNGFGSATRQEGLDYAHIQLVLECFAKFHAISFAFKDQNPEHFSKLAEIPFETYYHDRHWDWYKGMFKRVCVCAIDAVEKEYPGTIYVDKIKAFATDKTFFEAAKAATTIGDTSVFSHGDGWTPNFLVKYKSGTTTPLDAKIIDFQLVRCASPALDIGFLIYGCTTEELRQQYYIKMLKHYHDKLSEQVIEMGSDPAKLYSWDKFMQEIKKYSFFGLAFSFESTPVIILDPEDAFDVDSITGNEAIDVSTIMTVKPIKSQAGRLRLAGNIIHAVDNGYI